VPHVGEVAPDRPREPPGKVGHGQHQTDEGGAEAALLQEQREEREQGGPTRPAEKEERVQIAQRGRRRSGAALLAHARPSQPIRFPDSRSKKSNASTSTDSLVVCPA